MRSWRLIGSFAIAAALAGCGGSGSSSNYSSGTPTGPTSPTSPAPLGANDVSIVNQSFTPGTISVTAGTTVTWHWNDCADSGGYGGYGSCISHSVTFDDGSGVASSAQTTGTFSRTFATAGTFKYHCAVHGAAAMSGSVVVK